MAITEEKRKFVRLNTLVDVTYSKKPPSATKKISISKNISKGGICLVVYEELKESQILDLKIYLPEDKAPVSGVGRVAWVKEFIIGDSSTGKRFDVGIEFIKMSEEDKNKINKYVFSCLPLSK